MCPEPHSWRSMEGHAWICRIIEQHIPQWTNGPCSYQLESWAHTLDKISLVLIAPTGSGKTTAFYALLLVMEHLLGNPIAGILQPPSHLIALIVTPLIELGNNHVKIEAVGLKAVSLSAESLSAASREGHNLFGEICLCQWLRLTFKEFDMVVRNETFQKNLVVYGMMIHA
ncbi:hypothetical protein L208DRAFT_1395771 [Tricholoma matsutake]|nr:hypothetical protein L208DRAFT_1395771 [Tricholoma matsutake 945]